MSLFPNTRVFISFGSFQITWYAILILTGALLAYALCQKTMKKWGYAQEVLDDYVFPMLVLGIIGARIWYVIFEWDYYSIHTDEIIKIWNGGLAIHGGLFVGIIFSYFYFKHKKISFLRMFDLIMPTVLLAQAFGRWGNFMNQEAYGGIVDASYYAHFPEFIKNQMYINGAYRQPTFLYESVCNLIGFLFITLIYRKYLYKRRGDCGFVYLVWYGMTRFVIEGMRTDSLMIGDLRTAQIVSIVLMILGLIGLCGIYHKVFHLYHKPVVLFDLDGTLIDSKELVFESFRRTFKEEKDGYECSKSELESFFGPPLEDSFKRYFPEADIQKVCDTYIRISRDIHDEYVKQIPNAKETVEKLKDMGIKVAVVSNKRHDNVMQGLRSAGLDKSFDAILGKEDLPVPKPDPSGLIEACKQLDASFDDCIYIGDTPSDIKAAKAMAAYSIGYSPDEGQRKELEKMHPCMMIDDLSELISLCKEEKSWNDNTIW